MSFAAFGKQVSSTRRREAETHLREIGVENAEDIFRIIHRAAFLIEKDKPMELVEWLMKWVDLTGAYRVIAVLCTDIATKLNKEADELLLVENKK